MGAEILERIRAIEELPSLPAVAVEVLRLTQSENASVAQIAQVIQRDPALTCKLLKTANSSLFGMPRTISSVQQAMMVLGLRTVKVLVLGFSLVEAMNGEKSGQFDYVAYWRRSLTTAIAARLLAEKHNRDLADEAFVSGLLCDIGIMAAARTTRTSCAWAPCSPSSLPTGAW